MTQQPTVAPQLNTVHHHHLYQHLPSHAYPNQNMFKQGQNYAVPISSLVNSMPPNFPPPKQILKKNNSSNAPVGLNIIEHGVAGTPTLHIPHQQEIFHPHQRPLSATNMLPPFSPSMSMHEENQLIHQFGTRVPTNLISSSGNPLLVSNGSAVYTTVNVANSELLMSEDASSTTSSLFLSSTAPISSHHHKYSSASNPNSVASVSTLPSSTSNINSGIIDSSNKMSYISTIPSKVIHFRNVVSEITQAELINLCLPFGQVTHVLLLKNNQALVQFQTLESAIAFIKRYGAKNVPKKDDMENYETISQDGICGTCQAQIRGIKVYPNFSSHQELSKGCIIGDSSPETEPQNNILLATIYNAPFPINVTNLHQIFSEFGKIDKIVIFNKSAGLQALIQYEKVSDALLAKCALHGQNLYNNSNCSLSIQFSNLTVLTVHQNSDRAFDYTSLNAASTERVNATSSLFSQVPYSQWNNLNGHQQQIPPINTAIAVSLTGNGASNSDKTSPTTLSPVIDGKNITSGEKTVLLVSNLNDKEVDCSKLFNLFSCYGYVVRIKIFQTKPDHALVQFLTSQQAQLAISCLKGIDLFGKKLSINFSKHSHINTATSGESSKNNDLMHDYCGTSLNRFSRSYYEYMQQTEEQSPTTSDPSHPQRYMCQPTTVLHIANIGNQGKIILDEGDLRDLLSRFGDIEGIRLYEHKQKPMALVKFKDLESCIKCLCTMHNQTIKGQTLKIAFSTNKL